MNASRVPLQSASMYRSLAELPQYTYALLPGEWALSLSFSLSSMAFISRPSLSLSLSLLSFSLGKAKKKERKRAFCDNSKIAWVHGKNEEIWLTRSSWCRCNPSVWRIVAREVSCGCSLYFPQPCYLFTKSPASAATTSWLLCRNILCNLQTCQWQFILLDPSMIWWPLTSVLSYICFFIKPVVEHFFTYYSKRNTQIENTFYPAKLACRLMYYGTSLCFRQARCIEILLKRYKNGNYILVSYFNLAYLMAPGVRKVIYLCAHNLLTHCRRLEAWNQCGRSSRNAHLIWYYLYTY